LQVREQLFQVLHAVWTQSIGQVNELQLVTEVMDGHTLPP
jgi:hypothetical protein